jgi:hypothetical protein
MICSHRPADFGGCGHLLEHDRTEQSEPTAVPTPTEEGATLVNA